MQLFLDRLLEFALYEFEVLPRTFHVRLGPLSKLVTGTG